ncbi:MAG: LD-carboxypeptidase [Austwickia sp.]|nr:LD-carboxypeptidase [Austwickia sp.]MBK8437227.1 LD-carboxypeptidase [Austwickia sp.]MBK9102461.1 LD-carboxypeptidase [Austwickia sp.]
MPIRFPAPLAPGDRIGVTAPSSGVGPDMQPRLQVALECVRRQGYEVVLGSCMSGAGHVSAPVQDRAEELNWMLTDPGIRAVVPPWGGETGIDLVEHLDWAGIEQAEPTWLVGYSDISTLLTPITLVTGIATLHGNNLMDTPYRTPAGLTNWLDIITREPGDSFDQRPPGMYRSTGDVDYVRFPEISQYTLDMPTTWRRLDSGGPEPVEITGRLIGGCIETMANLAGTAYADVGTFAVRHAPEGLIVYVEAALDNAGSVCRKLHGMRLAGFFQGARAVLIGRTTAPWMGDFSQYDAVCDALEPLGVPLIADVECGHVAPHLPLVNGALATVRFGTADEGITQRLA